MHTALKLASPCRIRLTRLSIDEGKKLKRLGYSEPRYTQLMTPIYCGQLEMTFQQNFIEFFFLTTAVATAAFDLGSF